MRTNARMLSNIDCLIYRPIRIAVVADATCAAAALARDVDVAVEAGAGEAVSVGSTIPSVLPLDVARRVYWRNLDGSRLAR